MTAIKLSVQASMTIAAQWRSLAVAVEESGFDTLYVADHPATSPAPFVALAAAAAVTEHLRLGTCVVNIGRWDPLPLAIEVATLDVLSGGRVTLGVGAGHTPNEWSMMGEQIPSAHQRVARMCDVVLACRSLLAGDEVSIVSKFFELNHAQLSTPLAIQTPVPLMVGGNGPQLLRFAATHADVVGVTGLTRTLPDGHSHEVDWSPQTLSRTFDMIRDSAAASGRVPQIEALVQHVQITEDPVSAAAAFAEQAPSIEPGDILAAPFMWIGSVQTIAERLQAFQSQFGITRYVIREPFVDVGAQIISRLNATS